MGVGWGGVGGKQSQLRSPPDPAGAMTQNRPLQHCGQLPPKQPGRPHPPLTLNPVPTHTPTAGVVNALAALGLLDPALLRAVTVKV